MKTILALCAFLFVQSAFASIVVPTGKYSGTGTWTQVDASGNTLATGPLTSTWTQQNSDTAYIGTDDSTYYTVDAQGNQTVVAQNQGQYQFVFDNRTDANGYTVMWLNNGQSTAIGTGEVTDNGSGYTQSLNQQGIILQEDGSYDAATTTLSRSGTVTLPDNSQLSFSMTLTLENDAK